MNNSFNELIIYFVIIKAFTVIITFGSIINSIIPISYYYYLIYFINTFFFICKYIK